MIEMGLVIDFFTKIFYYINKKIESKGKIYLLNPETRDASEVKLSLRGLLFPKPSVIPIIPGTSTLVILGVLSWGKPQVNVIEFQVEDSEYPVDYSNPVIVYLHTFEGASSREKAEQQPLRPLSNVDVEINDQPIGRTDENGILMVDISSQENRIVHLSKPGYYLFPPLFMQEGAPYDL